MRFAFAAVCAIAVANSAFAGLSYAVIDDFSGSAGLGYTRSESGGASLLGGEGLLPAGGGFGYVGDYNATGFNGVSLKVTGDLSNGSLELYMVGANTGFVAFQVALNSFVSNGYVWITFDQIDAAVGNEPGLIVSSMAGGEGIAGIGLTYSGTGSIVVDDFQFGVAAVPAPGAIALLGLAGLAGNRRRR
jgi:hypothetical protein